MPYAANGIINKDTPIEGGIKITEDEYRQALDAKLRGDEIRVVDGIMEIYTPSRERTTYWLPPAVEHQTEPGEEPPEDAVLVEPPDRYHVIKNGKWVRSLEREREFMTLNKYQLRAGLLNENVLDEVESMDMSPQLRVAWDHKDRIRRNDPVFKDLFDGLGWDKKKTDDFFRSSMEIEP